MTTSGAASGVATAEVRDLVAEQAGPARVGVPVMQAHHGDGRAVARHVHADL